MAADRSKDHPLYRQLTAATRNLPEGTLRTLIGETLVDAAMLEVMAQIDESARLQRKPWLPREILDAEILRLTNSVLGRSGHRSRGEAMARLGARPDAGAEIGDIISRFIPAHILAAPFADPDLLSSLFEAPGPPPLDR